MVRRIPLLLIVGFFSTTLVAQSDLVKTRRTLMEASEGHLNVTMAKMARGLDPYDQAKVDAGFAQMKDMAAKLPALFPESTKGAPATGRYEASAKIWEKKADFDARIARLAKDIAESAPKATGLDGLKAVLPPLREGCNSCHEEYRVRVK